MAGEISKLWVFLGLKSELGAGLAKEWKASEKQFKNLQFLGNKLTGLGGAMTKAFTIPIAGLAAGAVAAAVTVDEAMDTIRAGTGATGDTLSSLGKSFRAVFTSVPASAEDTAQAIADLNTRLGLTGPALDVMSEQMLNLARLTKTQVGPLVESMTRVFGDWSIATNKQGAALDWLFKVSQSTGIQIDRLGQLIVQYGAPLRQMGFSFEEASTLMGKFEKEGVNLELVMGSLRIALGKMAKEGVTDAHQALSVLIQRIKDAGSVGEANALAIQTFGSRAGPDMAAAIREGRFEIGNLVKTLTDSRETINTAAQDTMSFGEQWTLVKNNVISALEPLGTTLLTVFQQDLLPVIMSAITWLQGLADKFAALPPATQDIIIAIGAALAITGPLLMVLGSLIVSFTALAAAVNLGIWPLTLIVAGIAAVIAATILIAKHWDDLKAKAKEVWEGIVAFIQPVIDVVQGIIDKVKEAINWLGRLLGLNSSVSVPAGGPVAGSSGVTAAHQANGGITTSPGLSWVGERGPELLWLPGKARVMPLEKLPGRPPVTINIYGPDKAEVFEWVQEALGPS